jgi:hypothetical protein
MQVENTISYSETKLVSVTNSNSFAKRAQEKSTLSADLARFSLSKEPQPFNEQSK